MTPPILRPSPSPSPLPSPSPSARAPSTKPKATASPTPAASAPRPATPAASPRPAARDPVTTSRTARERFNHESGVPNRAYVLQTRLDHGHPVNAAPIGGVSSATNAVTTPPKGIPTVEELHRAIQGFSRDPSIPYSFVQDGCYARAEVMSKALEAKGIPTNKIWAFAETEPLEVPGTTWGYHVSTQAKAWNPKTCTVENYVIDPSMANKPLTPSEWVAKMNPSGAPVRMDVTTNDAYLPDLNSPGHYFKVDDPAVKTYGMEPDETLTRYSEFMRRQGKAPNSGPPDGIPSDAEVAASGTGKLARIGGVVSRGLGVVAAVGGGFQIAGGVDEIRKGQIGDGSVDVTCGTLNAAGGTMVATGVGAVAAPFLFGASSVIDGGRDLVHGYQDGNGEKLAVGGAKVLGGGAMIAGGALIATGVGAPVGAALIVGGAVVSGGAALYDAFHEQINSAVSSTVETVGHIASNTLNAAGDLANNAWNAVTSWF